MRVLIVSAFIACAVAAPSGFHAHYPAPLIYSALPIPAAIPTISPGDLQAAAIDAQVKANDLARAAADQAQEAVDNANKAVEQNVEDGKAITDATLASEKNEEALWSAEEKKWQALNALQTAQAQIDGAAASNADAYAKAVVGAPTLIAAQPAPFIPYVAAPLAPAVYTPFVAGVAGVKTISTQAIEVKAEENKEVMKEEAAVKTAEPAAESDSVKVEADASAAAAPAASAESSAAPEKPAELENKPIAFGNPVVAPFYGVYRYNVALPGLSQFVAQPVVNYATPTSYQQQVRGVWAPTVVKHAW